MGNVVTISLRRAGNGECSHHLTTWGQGKGNIVVTSLWGARNGEYIHHLTTEGREWGLKLKQTPLPWLSSIKQNLQYYDCACSIASTSVSHYSAVSRGYSLETTKQRFSGYSNKLYI